MLKSFRKLAVYFLFVPIPILFIFLALLIRNTQGPFWMAYVTDPDYAYLFNSLSITQALPIGHFDHPGTPLQSLGAIVIQFLYSIRQQPNLVTDVLTNAEIYLNGIHNTLIILNAVSLFILGLVTYLITRRILFGLIIQLTPFLSSAMLSNPLFKVAPETLLFSVSLLFSLAILLYYFKPAVYRISLILFSLTIGLGTATKLIFFPLILIPLVILPNIKSRVVLIIGSIISFYIFTKPIVSSYPALWDWVKKLFISSGRDGTGSPTIIDLSTFIPNILAQVYAEPFFFIILILSILFLTFLIFQSKFRKSPQQKLFIKTTFSIIITQSILILMIAKHPGPDYLLPVLGLTGVTIILTINYISKNKILYYLWNDRRILILLSLFFFGIVFLKAGTHIDTLYQNKNKLRTERLNVYNEVKKNYPNSVLITYFRSSNPFYALRFGNIFVNSNFSTQLANLYPNSYFWDIWNAQLSGWDNQGLNLNIITERNPNKEIILQGTSFENIYADYPNYKPRFPIINVLNGKEETIYKVNHDFVLNSLEESNNLK